MAEGEVVKTEDYENVRTFKAACKRTEQALNIVG